MLRDLLVDRYADFRARLTRQLGSEDLANETLHETWLHLHRQDDTGPVRSAPAFLMRIAENVARDRLRSERRRAHRSEIEVALQMADSAPSPERAAQSRLDLKVVQRAIRELPERTRTILIASRQEGLSHQQIADRLGISRRTVLYELRQAVVQLSARLETRRPSDCTPKPPESS